MFVAVCSHIFPRRFRFIYFLYSGKNPPMSTRQNKRYPLTWALVFYRCSVFFQNVTWHMKNFRRAILNGEKRSKPLPIFRSPNFFGDSFIFFTASRETRIFTARWVCNLSYNIYDILLSTLRLLHLLHWRFVWTTA